jgi:nudix-type nucleoside diphosphatase (YffH/AdpP family)
MADNRTSVAEAVHVETLSESWYPLRKYSIRYRQREGTTKTLEREVYFNGPGAAVLPFDPERGTLLLIRQFRAPPFANGDDPWLIEVPAGNVEEGDDPAETVRKEAEQETGYELTEVRHVHSLYVSPGASAEKLHLFVARYAPVRRRGPGGGPPGAGVVF